jgi:hypothetical protein
MTCCRMQSSKWKFEFTGPNQILEFILYIYLNKSWKIYWSEQSFTGLRSEEQCSSWGLDSGFLQVLWFFPPIELWPFRENINCMFNEPCHSIEWNIGDDWKYWMYNVFILDIKTWINLYLSHWYCWRPVKSEIQFR